MTRAEQLNESCPQRIKAITYAMLVPMVGRGGEITISDLGD